jgi:hypothetical protein
VLVYRAVLDVTAPELLAVGVRRRWAPRGFGSGALPGRFRVTVRYAGPDGLVRTHRGQVAARVPDGAVLAVAGVQVAGSEVLITFRPAPAVARASRGLAVSDRFRVPIRLQAWGVTALTGAEVAVRASCRARDDALLLRGTATVALKTPAASFPLRIPFCRLVAGDTGEGLCWEARAGVSGLHLRVGSGGLITGELVVAARCEGRPREPSGPPASEPVRNIREIGCRVAGVAGEHAGAGHAVVRGTAELDIYWVAEAGRSRWTGRSVPFSALLELEGLREGDRLDAWCRVERLAQHGPIERPVASLVLGVGVTALRPANVVLDGVPYRLEQVRGAAATTLTTEVRLWGGGATEDRAGGPGAPAAESRTVALPLAGPAEGWEEVAAVLTPEAAAGARGQGRWRVRAALGGTPLGQAPYPVPLKAETGGVVTLGPQEALSVVPALTGVDAGGVRLTALVARGPQLPAGPARAEARGEVVEAEAPVPGRVEAILAVAAEQGPGRRVRVRILVRLAGHGLHRACADVAGGANPLSQIEHVTVFSALRGDQWYVRAAVFLTMPEHP